MSDTLRERLDALSYLLECTGRKKMADAVYEAIAELDRLEAEVKKLAPSTEPVQAAGDGAGERAKCGTCGGDGFRRITEGLLAGPCERCNGSGEVVIWGAKVVSWDCPNCNGTGRLTAPASPSDQGQGSGTPTKQETAEKPKPVSLVEKFSRERIGGNIDYWAKNTFGSPSHDQEAREIILWILRTLDQERCV